MIITFGEHVKYNSYQSRWKLKFLLNFSIQETREDLQDFVLFKPHFWLMTLIFFMFCQKDCGKKMKTDFQFVIKLFSVIIFYDNWLQQILTKKQNKLKSSRIRLCWIIKPLFVLNSFECDKVFCLCLPFFPIFEDTIII
jgi:hypothetical protein